MTIQEVLDKHHYTRKRLSEEFHIPITTIHKWCAPKDSENHRDCPVYIVEMIDRILNLEEQR